MTEIRRLGQGSIAVTITDGEFIALSRLEADLLGSLADRLTSLADGRLSPNPLFPDAYRDDSEASAEFHALTDVDLVSAKSEGARGVMSAFAGEDREASAARWRRMLRRTATFDPTSAVGLLRNLTDLRLMVARRLGIEHDDDPGHAGRSFARDRAVYWWLGETQELLVAAMEADALDAQR